MVACSGKLASDRIMNERTTLDQMTYDAHGPMTTRSRDIVTATSAVQTIEKYAWDPYGLVKRFEIQRDVVFGNTAAGCAADASNVPASIWTYRFNPLNEREQKRQTSTAGELAVDGLAWTYYQIGSDKGNLTTFNGIEGGFCGDPVGTLHMWAVERNTIGPRGVRLIQRPNAEVEYVVSDHLGSTRAVVSQQGEILETIDYRPFGSVLHTLGEGARTGYIDREEDGESGLGCYGVRLYEPEYGRFTSVDPLWQEFDSYSTYHYSFNDPIGFLDYSGLGPGDLFKSELDAAIDWGFTYATETIMDGKERASTIYKVEVDGEMMFGYNEANVGSTFGSSAEMLFNPKQQETARIHSHPAERHSEYPSKPEQFSPQDKDDLDGKSEAQSKPANGYLVTPAGNLLFRSVETKKVIAVGDFLPVDPQYDKSPAQPTQGIPGQTTPAVREE